MDNKKIIIIGIILLIIVAGIILLMMTSANYERIEITPNGTSIEVPANQTKCIGHIGTVKVWNWNDGILVTANSQGNSNISKLTELSFNNLNDLIKNGDKKNFDGITCYVIKANDLLKISIFNAVKVNYNGKFYCIPLSNETTHDNLIICCKDKDVALHMAKSVQYKNVNLTSNSNYTIPALENITGNLLANG
ncbi:hypothetical protein [uncultured Methanobrevibacter sp.]|uniref:hypothetical protein n=1 Tax=uncultured Methanobrevibacter sp. TaxID=253161 RepID=UPI0025D143BF|nr:hypothetical protein [uncultured Methanobrevibacter sp.]